MRKLPPGPVLGLVLAAVALSPGAAQDAKVGDLVIRHPWTRATPGGADVAGGYLSVVNTGSTSDRLIGASLAAAARSGLHEMTDHGGVMEMRPTGPLEIAAGATLTLSPSGKHIMFTGLKRALRKGDTVDGTLVFEHAGTVPVHFVVESIGARAPESPSVAGHHGPSMPGMPMN